jgi:uncharacterized protein (DUF1499 family)
MAQKSGRRLVIIPLGVAVLLVAAVLIVRFAVSDADTDFVDFATLKRPSAPNTALACPSGFCAAAGDLVTEPVALSTRALVERLLALSTAEPRVTEVRADPSNNRFVFIQRSLIFAFPDTVNVAIQAIDPDHAAVAIYSRSNYGRGDLGVNLTRVKRWLDRLGVPWAPAATP